MSDTSRAFCEEGRGDAAKQGGRPARLSSLGSRVRMRVFEMLVACRALFAARALMHIVVFWYVCTPSVRRRIRPYLRRRFPSAGRIALFLRTWRLYKTFAGILFDRMVAGILGRFPQSVLPKDQEDSLRAALHHPRGCIVLSGHLGAWQIGLAGLARLGGRVNVVQLATPNDPDRHYFERGKGDACHIIDASDMKGCLVEAAMRLRRGETVCFMGDRLIAPPDAGNSVPVPFLGGRIALPVQAYALASMTGALLLPLFALYDAGRMRLVMDAPVSLPQGLDRRKGESFLPWALRFGLFMEKFTEAHPEQFFNFYDMWLSV